MGIATSEYSRTEALGNQTQFSKNRTYVDKLLDKDGHEVKDRDYCNDRVIQFTNDYTPKNKDINPPKKDGKKISDTKMPWFDQTKDKKTAKGIVSYYNDIMDERNERHKNDEVLPASEVPECVKGPDGKWNGNIPFDKDGVPDLSFLSRGTVTIGIEVYGRNILNGKGKKGKKKDGRDKNFTAANDLLAKQIQKSTGKECTAADVEQWMKDNGYTWHEMDENGTMQKVPSAVHGAVFHYGGVNKFKQLYAEGKLEGIDFNSSYEEAYEEESKLNKKLFKFF